MKRQDGFYWVEINNEWIIAQYYESDNIWFVAGNDCEYDNENFGQIDEQRIERK